MNDTGTTLATSTHATGGGGGADSAALGQLNAEAQQQATSEQQSEPPTNGAGWQNPRAAMLDEAFGQSAASRGIGAGFEFDPLQIQSQIAQCSQLLAELQADLVAAQLAEAAIQPPAPDPASVAQATAVKGMFTETVAAIRSSIDYLSTWQSQVSQAKDSYLNTEHVTTDEWNRLTNGTMS